MSQSIAEQDGTLNPQKGKRIKVIHGELLAQQNMDAIVSFLTEDLSWGGPVNQQILALTEHQVDRYLLEHGDKPAKGKAFSTPSFNVPCKVLIFAVISDWDDGFSGAERFLKLALKNAMHEAEKSGLKRISIPSMGAEAGGFPVARAARVFFNALSEADLAWFDEVRIVCKSEDAFREYEARLGGLA